MEDNFFLACILYLFTEGADEEVQLYGRIMRHAYANVEEVIFAAYVLYCKTGRMHGKL